MDWMSANPFTPVGIRTNPRGRPKRHKDVEFHVETAERHSKYIPAKVYDTWDEATSQAVGGGLVSGRPFNIDVVVFSEAGVRWWAGDDGVERYREDPDASVFERIEVRVDDKGRVP